MCETHNKNYHDLVGVAPVPAHRLECVCGPCHHRLSDYQWLRYHLCPGAHHVVCAQSDKIKANKCFLQSETLDKERSFPLAQTQKCSRLQVSETRRLIAQPGLTCGGESPRINTDTNRGLRSTSTPRTPGVWGMAKNLSQTSNHPVMCPSHLFFFT